MLRKIIKINEETCNGCGACAEACHEGAIAMVNGRAKLIREDYCDGMGDCLPECPTGAITFEEREAAAYDEQAAAEHKKSGIDEQAAAEHKKNGMKPVSALGSWPIQIKLAPVKAPYFDKAGLLIAADCTAYAYAALHTEFMQGRITLIGCPKLDDVDYSEKLAEIIRQNDIQSINVTRMEVPCCGGLEMAVKKALQKSGKHMPLQIITISINGNVLDRQETA